MFDESLTKYGFPGVVVLILLTAVVALWKYNNKLAAKITSLVEKFNGTVDTVTVETTKKFQSMNDKTNEVFEKMDRLHREERDTQQRLIFNEFDRRSTQQTQLNEALLGIKMILETVKKSVEEK